MLRFQIFAQIIRFPILFAAKYFLTDVKVIFFRSLYAVLEIRNEDRSRNDTEKVNFPKGK